MNEGLRKMLIDSMVREKYRPLKVDGKWDGLTFLVGRSSRIEIDPESPFGKLATELVLADFPFAEPKATKPKTKKQCVFPECEEEGSHPHHIVYKPSIVKPLCPKHHREITCVNINQAEKTRRKLSNKHRFWAWGAWLRGELHPIMTANAANWFSNWRD